MRNAAGASARPPWYASVGMLLGLAVLAIAQMGRSLIVSGSLWIMARLNANMMPASAIMEMQR